MDQLESKEFTVHRVVVARITAEEYARQFWWFIAPGPMFGIVLLLFMRDPLFQAIGALGCVWPLTIPFRAYFISARLANALSMTTKMKLVEDGITFLSPLKSFYIPYKSLRNVTERHGYIILNTKRFTTMLMPKSALEEPQVSDFYRIVKEHGVLVRLRQNTLTG
jgi:hypothetical protein